MENSSPSSGQLSDNRASSPEISTAQAELLQNVLDTEQSAPWLATEVADEYASEVEAAGSVLEFSDDEVAKGWEGLSATLNQIWGETTLLAQLQAKFSNRLPSDFLAMIGEKAQQVAKSGQPMVDQLISCVQDGFENMATADLQVMARPMAFAMRGSSADEFVDATVQSVRKDDWEALSPVEQARLSLAAARYAISQVED